MIDSIRRVLDKKRQTILKSLGKEDAGFAEITQERLLTEVSEELAAAMRPSLRPVINATGVVLHTNLGRAPLSPPTIEQILKIARGYSNLELDLTTGARGSRYVHVEELLCQITGAESALVVNNNAGAVFLALNSLAEGREVIVSRGQLVEIGGSFRIPDVMGKSGAHLVEVGTTNRTHLEDYEKAFSEKTALLLKVHTSNFRLLGFTSEVTLKELVDLGRAKGLPVMEDLGSGCLVDLAEYGIGKEPTVQEAIEAGADLLTFSGDKLLGGPQAGIILGKKKYLDLLKKNPLHRALRIDKLTLAGIEATVRLYLNRGQAVQSIPVLRMLTCLPEELERRAKRLQRKLAKDFSAVCRVHLRPEFSQVGGGALPLQVLPTHVVALGPLKISAANLEQRLRSGYPPVMARVKEGEVLLDLRTVAKTEERDLLEGVRRALE